MKKIIISILAIFVVATLSAQEKKDMYLAGHLGISTASVSIGSNGSNATKFSLTPEFGYFAAKNFRIGASFSYALSTSSETDSSEHTIAITPNLAYYVRIMKAFYYTPTLEIGFVCGINGKVTSPGFGLGLALGSFEFRPTTKFGLSLNLLTFEYSMRTVKGSKENLNGVSFHLGMSPTLGLKYYF